MTEHRKREREVSRINPRSVGTINSDIFSKTSGEVNFEPEALEIKRCSALNIKTKHIFTPDFVSYDKPTNMLSTKMIHGSQLFLTLWNPTTVIGKLKGKRLEDVNLITSRMGELGSWLSMYHKSTDNQDEHLHQAMTWLQDSAKSKIKGMRDNNLASVKKLSRIEQRLMKDIEELGNVSQHGANICQIHGDFIIYNMLIDKDSNLHVLDFGDTRIGCNLDDIARIYSNLIAIAHTSRWRKKLFLNFAHEFLESYGLDANVTELPYFRALMAYNFLIHIYGQFYMRELLSFMSALELSQISKAGMTWIETNYI